MTLLEFVVAREAVRKKKESGAPWPWTKNPILQQYRFTNVRRSDDRVTRWLVANVLSVGYVHSSLPEFLKFVALCRQVNWPPTIKLVMQEFDWPNSPKLDYESVGAFIDELMAKGVKVWTSAYLVRAKPGHGKGKGHYVAVEVVDKPFDGIMPDLLGALNSNSRKAVWEQIYAAPNWGSFSAGQVVADLGETPLLSSATDTFMWAPQGPGSIRGFNRALGRPVKQKIPEAEWLAQLIAWRQEIVAALGPEYDKTLTLADVQNCCCEYSKIAKVLEGSGRPRSKYKPETAF